MIPSLGHAAVVIGLLLSVYAAGAFALGARRSDARVLDSARRAVYATFGLALAGCLAMVALLLAHDFSVLYVVRNNATTTPPFYSVISLWAALEGSILFWALMATGWAALVLHRFRHRHRRLMPWVGATLASVNAFFFAVMTWPSNPFTRITPVAAEGVGPNALLQNHPFMAVHPPLLYLGYTGLAVPFAFAIAALVTRRSDEAWLSIVRRWTVVPWIFLTAGIVAGAWWSYEVLGWGGYWEWDPVENAALLPWLTATAFLHSAMVAERRRGLRTWTVALVIATFVLTLVGTFLTRSGIVASVHSFTASAIGAWFLGGIIVALTASLALLVWRLPDLAGGERPGATLSRESAFLLNNVLFIVITFTVLFGTLYPLFVQVATGEVVSLGAPWYNRVALPLFATLLFLMGVGPALPWGRASAATIRGRFVVPLLLAVVGTVAAWLLGLRGIGPLGTLGLACFVAAVMLDEIQRGVRARRTGRGEALPLAAWRLGTRNRRRYGGYAVHLGVLVMAVGIAISSGLASDTLATVRPGQEISIRGYTLTYDRLVTEPLASDARVTETRAELTYRGPQAGTLATSLRDYPNAQQLIATPAVRTTLVEDLYVTLLAFSPGSQEASIRVFVNPMVVWIWIGGGVVGIGAAFAAWPDRRRSPAAVAQREPAPAAAGRPASVEGS